MLAPTYLRDPIATFVSREPDTAEQDKRYNFTLAPKGPLNIISTFEDHSELLSSRTISRIGEISGEKSSNK